MAPIRSSNIERRRWRNECREKLAKHLRDRLGIRVEPSRVRLSPGAEDQYIWKILPEKEKLLSKIFEKSLSDHSIGVYKELFQGVGVTFEAVPIAAATGISNANAQDSLLYLNTLNRPELSFSAKIDNLQEENARLTREVSEWRDQAAGRQQAEEEVSQLRGSNQRLQLEAQNSEITAEYFRNSVLKYTHGLKKILPMLEELKTEMPLGISGALIC